MASLDQITNHQTHAIMARNTKKYPCRIDLEVTPEVVQLFNDFKKKNGFKTKAQAFQAMMNHPSLQHLHGQSVLGRIETKLDLIIERLEDVT